MVTFILYRPYINKTDTSSKRLAESKQTNIPATSKNIKKPTSSQTKCHKSEVNMSRNGAVSHEIPDPETVTIAISPAMLSELLRILQAATNSGEQVRLSDYSFQIISILLTFRRMQISPVPRLLLAYIRPLLLELLTFNFLAQPVRTFQSRSQLIMMKMADSLMVKTRVFSLRHQKTL